MFHAAWVDSDALVLFAFCSVDVLDPLQFWISHVGLVLFRVQPALVLTIVENGLSQILSHENYQPVLVFQRADNPSLTNSVNENVLVLGTSRMPSNVKHLGLNYSVRSL